MSFFYVLAGARFISFQPIFLETTPFPPFPIFNFFFTFLSVHHRRMSDGLFAYSPTLGSGQTSDWAAQKRSLQLSPDGKSLSRETAVDEATKTRILLAIAE